MLTTRVPRPHRTSRPLRAAVVVGIALGMLPAAASTSGAAPGDLITPVLTITADPAEPVVGEGFWLTFTVEADGAPAPDGPVQVALGGGASFGTTVGGGGRSINVVVAEPQLYPAMITYPGTDTIAGAAAGWSYDFLFYRESQTVTLAGLPASVPVGATPAFVASTTSGLPLSMGASGSCYLSGSTVVTTAVGTCRVTAAQLGDGTTAPAFATWDVAVTAPAEPPGAPTGVVAVPADGAAVVTWNAPAVTNGDLLSYSVLYRVPGDAWGPPVTVVAPAPGSPPPTTATIPGLTNGVAYEVGVVAQNATGFGAMSAVAEVTPMAPSVTTVAALTEPLTTTFTVLVTVVAGGAPLPGAPVAVQVDGGLPTLLTTGPDGTVAVPFDGLPAGPALIQATFPGTSTAWSSIGWLSVTVRQPQTIGLAAALPAVVVVGQTIPLPPTTSADLPVAYTTETPGACALDGSSLTIVSSATCSIAGSNPGNTMYAPVVESATLAPVLAQVIGLDEALPAADVVGESLSLPTLTSAGLPVTYETSTPGVCAVAGTTLSLVAGGSCTVSGSAPGDGTHAPVTEEVTFAVLLAQTIGLDAALPAASPVGGTIELPTTTSAGRPVSYLTTTPGVCVVSGSTLSLLAVGPCSVEASNAGDGVYASVLEGVTFDVTLRPQTISGPGDVGVKRYGDAPFAFVVTATSGLPVTFTTTGPCAVVGENLELTGVGTCEVTAHQAGDATWAPAPDASWVIPVLQRLQTVTITGAPASFDGAGQFTVQATSSVGAAVTIAASGACAAAGEGTAVVRVIGVGECVITADAAGDTLTAAATATARLTVTAEPVDLELTLGGVVGDAASGTPVHATGSGLRPGATLTVTVYSDPVLLGSATVGSGGGGEVSGALPALGAGTHRLVLAGTALDGSAVRTELAFGVGADGTITWVGHAEPGRMAVTGADVAGLGLLSLLAVLAGALLLVARRRGGAVGAFIVTE